jgi:hypothetical protein
MKDKNWYATIIIGCLIIFGALYYWVVNFSPKVETPEDVLMRKIDSLTTKVDSIHRANDSIKIIIDTTEVQINHVYEEYIQIHDRIITQSTDSDCLFFSRYLSENSQRFIDTINIEPIKAN